MSLACAARRLTQRLDLLGQKTAATIEKIRREKPASARDKRATIIGHIAKLTQSVQRAIDDAHAPTERAAFLGSGVG
jgi:hypothetical protein